jgi:hypothetical protein
LLIFIRITPLVELFADVIVSGFPQGCGRPAAMGQASRSLLSIDFENTVFKYMDMDMKVAEDYLQSKGFCLIPTAQPTAISNGTTKPQLGSRATNFDDRQSSGKQPASKTFNSFSGIVGMGSAGSHSDFHLKEN